MGSKGKKLTSSIHNYKNKQNNSDVFITTPLEKL